MESLSRGPRLLSYLLLAVCLVPAHKLHSQTLPYPVLQPGYSQELFGSADTSGVNLGGVAFAADGSVWSKVCDASVSLVRFDAARTATVNGTTIHPQAAGSPVATAFACGLTNHPDGRLYMNTPSGVMRIDAGTGAVLGTIGPPGNSYGITVDPQTNRLVYPAHGCNGSSTCTLVTLDPASGSSATLATFASSVAFEDVDGIAFDPTGNIIGIDGRTGVFPRDTPFLTLLARNGAVVQQLPATHYPDGLGFHQNPFYLAANNNDGTITRYDFPTDDLHQIPVQNVIASGGFRGDLAGIGGDGCLYVTQAKTRYGNGAVTNENSVVRICSTAGGFLPAPGVSPQSTAPRTIAHIANGGGWRTTVILINTGTQPANFELKFWDNFGNPLRVDLGADGVTADLTGTIQPGVARFIRTAGVGSNLQIGWAELTATNDIDGNAIFGLQSPGHGDSEAAVPLSPSGGTELFVPFDYSTGYATGIAFADPGQMAATTSAHILDDANVNISAATTIQVPARGHYSNVLAAPFPGVVAKRGVAHFSSNTSIFGLGIRANGKAFTSIDALSGVTGAAKTIPHIANGGGWKTTFLLVCTAAQASQFTLKIWSGAGTPLPLPLGADGTVSTLSGTIQPGELRVIQTTGTGAPVTGWAEITDLTGAIGGTAIFALQSPGQSDSEAAVPFSTASSTHLFMPYDYSPGYATGIAFTNTNTNQVVVTASFTDDVGHHLGTGQIVVPGHGHASAVLADVLPAIAGTRGTVSLTANLPIFGLGIRANGVAFTSLKVIVK